MFRKRFLCPVLIAGLLAGVVLPASAVEVDCDATYCFTAADFSEEQPLAGICITQLPQPATGTVLLGQRVLRAGDILTADQLSLLTFLPMRTEENAQAELTYLPIYENRVEHATTMVIDVRGKEDQAPIAEDLTLETYKNLPNEGTLKVTDPEGQPMTFTVTRQPRRGEVLISTDGSFSYTPKKNKVGVDSFTYTATDPAGKVSREATVTIQILKPTDDKRYADTAQFEAEWLRHTGLFEGEKLGGQLCFQPEKAVTRGEFIAMVMKLLEISTDTTTLNENAPAWLQPYLAAAMRSGFMTDFPTEELDAPIGRKEAALLLQNALELTGEAPADAPTAADTALAVLNQNGLLNYDGETLTRAQMASLLYEVSHLAPTAPGLMVFRQM